MRRAIIGSFVFLIATFDVFPAISGSTQANGPAPPASSSDDNLNSVAYAMAESNTQLDDALKYSEKAVKDVEDLTSRIDLDQLTPADLRTTTRLAAFWDTLGWVYFRMGQLDKAERYIDASWRIAQDPVVGDHLGQIYEKEGKAQKAIMAYEGAAAGPQAVLHAKERLQALSDEESDDYTPNIPQDMQEMRTFNVQVAGRPKEHASAEFFMLLSGGTEVVGVKVVGDSDAIPSAEEVLKKVKFDVSFPDDGLEKILRRGMLDCEPEIPGCTVALMPPKDVRSVN